MTSADLAVKNILILHGPNLNLLGSREPDVYGSETLEEINGNLSKLATEANVSLVSFQSNSEADLISRIQQAMEDETDFIIINPAAFTHTSIALRDALSAAHLPFIEVHLTNIFARETFRRESYFSSLALGVISGLGAKSYYLALKYAINNC
jgi:3-dehydroquinate dehydratase-2